MAIASEKFIAVKPVFGRHGFQKCFISSTLRRFSSLQTKCWVGIPVKGNSVQFLVRLCDSETENTNANDVIRCDMRVVELITDKIHPLENKIKRENDSDIHNTEMNLAQNIMKLERREPLFTKKSQIVTSSKCTDMLYCIPKHIKMLACATIKTITLTIVFLNEDGFAPNDVISVGSLLKEYVRDILITNDIRVRNRCLIDLRMCPLAQSFVGFPPIRYLFVEACEMNSCQQNEFGVVGKNDGKTDVVIKQIQALSYYKRLFESCKENDVSIVGLEHPLRLVEDTIKMRNHRWTQSNTGFSGGLLLAGASSCGKTLVVREAARKLRANLFLLEVSTGSAQEASSFVSASTIIFSNAIKSSRSYPTILILQNLEMLGMIQENKSESLSVKMSHKLVCHLSHLLDSIPGNTCLTVIATSNKPFLLPMPFRRPGRLQQEMYLNLPAEGDRIRILKSITTKFAVFRNYRLDMFARKTPGYSRSDLEKLVRVINFKTIQGGRATVTTEDVNYGCYSVVPTSMQGFLGSGDTRCSRSLDDIAGLHSVKLDLVKAIVWPVKYPHAFFTMGIHPPKGILLYGPSGCAKTSVVRAVASSYETNFISVSAAELFSSGVGDSEKLVADLFYRARLASPCILFIDELEAVVGSRQVKTKGVNESILSTFLTEMDGVGINKEISTLDQCSSSCPRVVVIAATNRMDLIDSALLRPGRLDRVIAVNPPTELERQELLCKCLGKMILDEDVDVVKMARLTHNYSGADLVNLCKEAALLALEDDMNVKSVSMMHLMRSRAQSAPSIKSESLPLPCVDP